MINTRRTERSLVFNASCCCVALPVFDAVVDDDDDDDDGWSPFWAFVPVYWSLIWMYSRASGNLRKG